MVTFFRSSGASASLVYSSDSDGESSGKEGKEKEGWVFAGGQYSNGGSGDERGNKNNSNSNKLKKAKPKQSPHWLYPTRLSQEELAAVQAVMHEFGKYHDRVIRRVRAHAITLNDFDFSNRREIEVLLETYPGKERPFLSGLFATQQFTVYIEKLADRLQEKHAETRALTKSLNTKLKEEKTQLTAAKSLLSIYEKMSAEEKQSMLETIGDLTETIRDSEERLIMLKKTKAELKCTQFDEIDHMIGS
jgi:septal ring factor EnvC (AmiA/AmiB activator)